MKTKICFVALTAYPMLSGENLGYLTGPDVHTVLLGRELLKNNFDVAFVTYDEGSPLVEHIDGIEVIKTYHREDIPRLNFVLKALRIWNAMRKTRAQIYYHHGGASGVVPLFCRLMRKKSVWHIASDVYVKKRLKDFKLLARFGPWLDMKLASAIVTQTELQRVMLKKNFGRESMVIRNHFPVTRQGVLQKAEPPIMLWVGAMAEVKQPELFLRLAETIPEAKFQMIGGASTDIGLYERVKEASKRTPNLEFLGVIPFSEIDEYYSRAAVLVNTAKAEGFPYAFVQAWMNHTPIVSLNCDPDETICQYKMGFHSTTFKQLVDHVKTLLKNEELRRQMGENARRYVEENHDITKIVRQHIEVFDQLARPKQST